MIRALLLAATIASPALAEPSPMRADHSPGFRELVFAGDITAIARRDIGKSGPQMGLSPAAWCAEAINRWRRGAGLPAVPSRRAFDQLRHGRRVAGPVAGALMVTARRGGGHVDLVAAVHADGSITVIRPNWGRRVRAERIAPRGRFIIPG